MAVSIAASDVPGPYLGGQGSALRSRFLGGLVCHGSMGKAYTL